MQSLEQLPGGLGRLGLLPEDIFLQDLHQITLFVLVTLSDYIIYSLKVILKVPEAKLWHSFVNASKSYERNAV